MKVICGLLIYFTACVWCYAASDAIDPATIGDVGEVVITAPQYIDGNDTIGTIPGIVVYGSKQAVAYDKYRSHYVSITNNLFKYAGAIMLTVFTLSIILVAWVRRNMFAYEHVKHHKNKQSALHEYYLRCQKKKYPHKLKDN